MRVIKEIALSLAAAFSGIISFLALFILIELEINASFEQGKAIVFMLFLTISIFFGFITIKCCKDILRHRKDKQHNVIDVNTTNIGETHVNEEKHNLIEKSYIDISKNTTESLNYKELHEEPQQENSKIESTVAENVVSYHKFPKCNCDGCPRQEKCRFGHVIYDEFSGERMTLFDKFMLLDICGNDMPPEGSVTLATNEELHDMQLLMKLDKDAICETLDYLLEMKKWYYAYGKCGKAYFSFMKMENEISLVKESIRQYDEYHSVLNSIELLKKTIIYKAEKEETFPQEELYKEFEKFERSWITTAVRQLEKEKIIIREKKGKTYIIRKNKE